MDIRSMSLKRSSQGRAPLRTRLKSIIKVFNDVKSPKEPMQRLILSCDWHLVDGTIENLLHHPPVGLSDCREFFI